MSSIRNSAIELLRFLFIIGIVIGHVYAHGRGDMDWVYSLGSNWSTAIHLSLFSLGKLGVTGFIFISGYFGIKMSRKKWFNLLLMLICYHVILSFIFGHYRGGVIHSFHAWDSWWFVSAYVIICLCSSMIDVAFEQLKKRQLQIIVLGFLIYTYWGHFLMIANDHDFVLLLTVYLCARYLRLFPPSIITNRRILLYISILSLIFIVVIPVAIEMLTGNHTLQRFFLCNNNILLLVTTSSIVMIADQHPFYSKPINFFAKSVLAIYLITEWPDIREIINKLLLPKLLTGDGFILVIVIALACIVIESLRNLLFRKPVNYIYNCLFNETND